MGQDSRWGLESVSVVSAQPWHGRVSWSLSPSQRSLCRGADTAVAPNLKIFWLIVGFTFSKCSLTLPTGGWPPFPCCCQPHLLSYPHLALTLNGWHSAQPLSLGVQQASWYKVCFTCSKQWVCLMSVSPPATVTNWALLPAAIGGWGSRGAGAGGHHWAPFCTGLNLIVGM